MSTRMLGIALLIIGLVLAIFGFNATESVADTVSEGVTGRFTDKTMWYLIGGGALALVGGAIALSSGRRSQLR